MSFHVEQSEFDKCIIIIKCIGSLPHPHCIPLREAVREQLKLRKKAIILDFSQATTFGEALLEETFMAFTAARNQDSYLSFVFSEVAIGYLKIVNCLHVLVPYFRTLEEALSDAQSWCQEQNIYDRFAGTD